MKKPNKIEFLKTYKHYTNLNNSIPNFILEKLENMPNNKGYIWKGVYCYGANPPDSFYKTVMFEKHWDLLIIHEWDDKKYKIWHKKGKNKRILYSEKERIVKQLT